MTGGGGPGSSAPPDGSDDPGDTGPTDPEAPDDDREPSGGDGPADEQADEQAPSRSAPLDQPRPLDTTITRPRPPGRRRPPRERQVPTAGRVRARIAFGARRVVLAAMVGAVGGLAAIGLELGVLALQRFALADVAGIVPGTAGGEHVPSFLAPPATTGLRPAGLLAVIGLGGLLAGWLVYTFAPEAEGHGTDTAIGAYHRSEGRIRPVVPWVKLLASVLTLGTGGSGGREGPIALTGAGFGSTLATRLGLEPWERRSLLVAGIGGGLGAIFGAPLGGAAFAIEVLYREEDLEGDVLFLALVAAAVGVAVWSAVFSAGPLFVVPRAGSFVFRRPVLLAPLAVLTLAMTLAGGLFVVCFAATRRLFARLARGLDRRWHPMLGALGTGLLAIGLYEAVAAAGGSPTDRNLTLGTLGFGYGFLQQILRDGPAAAPVLLLFAVGLLRIVTTSLTVGSGGSAGVFGTSLVIGGALSAALVGTVDLVAPHLLSSTEAVAFVLLGMAAFFTSAAKTPLSTLIMVVELSGAVGLLFPGTLTVALAFVFSGRWSIYGEQVANRAASPARPQPVPRATAR